ncbi:TIGR03618 family F420-dependent PPOX class oxidoreductase [Fodinicola acaciae]|uniref:TIGR03618 family F420-dependent PPOX class oxidoreductase n=1 Tax=Fodinicola acaciae TaxID=2681555 RepID=UPI0013D65616|nr:TIGR03618 family F420-dependent PPOX class oxidoreductase [Fodinicola acaciae]
MSRRAAITMSATEIADFLAEQRTIVVASIGPNGRPHLVPLWYWPTGQVIETWTYGKSQKVHNLRRDPHATVLIETGDSYDQLRGVSLECDTVIDDTYDEVARIGLAMAQRYGGALTDAARTGVEAQARKRVLLRFTPTHVVSWDHRKLGGAY